MERRLARQRPERRPDAASQHADDREPPYGPEPVATLHWVKPQPRNPRPRSSCTPFSMEYQRRREKQGTKQHGARGQEPHHDRLSPRGGDERLNG
jgi:hypothetical protein